MSMAVTELPNALDRNTHIYIYIYIFSVQDNEIVTEIGGAVWIFSGTGWDGGLFPTLAPDAMKKAS